MRLVLAVLVLCGCRGATPVAVENRGGTARPSCDLPARIERAARRYGNVDADAPDFQTWSEWRIGLQLARAGDGERVRGTLAMTGDELTWTFDVSGTFDGARCRLALTAEAHDPMAIVVTLSPDGASTGEIRSIDDAWLLGPPFPARRP